MFVVVLFGGFLLVFLCWFVVGVFFFSLGFIFLNNKM